MGGSLLRLRDAKMRILKERRCVGADGFIRETPLLSTSGEVVYKSVPNLFADPGGLGGHFLAV